MDITGRQAMDNQAEYRHVKDRQAKDKSRKERCIDRIKNNSMRNYDGERPLNVAFIGCDGAGKSSLINTIGTSFRGYWEEHALSGSYGGHGKHLTVNVESFPMCCQGNNNNYQHWNLPTLTDVAGFPDECSDKWEELFRILIYGRLKVTSRTLKVQHDDDKLPVVPSDFPQQYLVKSFEVVHMATVIMGLYWTAYVYLHLNSDCKRLLSGQNRNSYPFFSRLCETRINGWGADFIEILLVVVAVKFGLFLFKKLVLHFFYHMCP